MVSLSTDTSAGVEGTAPSVIPSVGPTFIALYALAFISTSLLFMAPLLVTLALKLNDLVGSDRAPGRLSLVASIGAFVAMVGNPAFGQLSDRTTSRFGMRRPWMLLGLLGGTAGMLLVAVAPSVLVVVLGWSLAQLSFNALLAALVAVLPDQVPSDQRGRVAGVLGICVPIASVSGTYLVKLFSPNEMAMFLAPCLIGGAFVVLFTVTLKDRHLSPAERRPWSAHELASTFSINPRRCPDFAWAFVSRFLFVTAYAFLVTYQAYYLLDRVHTPEAKVPDRVFIATLVQATTVVAASLLGGSLSDRMGRRKIFVGTASGVYGVALFVIAMTSSFNGFLVGMAIGGLGFGTYACVDLALATDVLPDRASAAKDLGVFNIAGALPFSVAPAIAPAILAITGGSYSALYAVAGLSAVLGAAAIVPVRGVR